ncbi:MAG: globin family protein [Cyanobacteria bacterium P01_D01_bin.36]
MSLNVELLEQSFELVKPKADEFVASFYNNLFTDYPASKPLFEHSDMTGQQKMLKGALVMVVENLRKPEVLSNSLKGLGARHVKYGALPEHYPLVGNSLLKTLGQYAGDAWTPDLEGAWTEAYGAISELMLEGADYSKEEIALEAVPATSPPAEEGGLNVELLEQSFELVKPKADEFVASFYGNLLTDYPEAKPLFAHTSMPKQQQMLKGALVMVVENLRKPEVLSESLGGLGARHVKYGALPEHYPLVGNSLLKTLGQYAGDAWTPELKSAWTDAYGAITELMLDGADYSKSDIQLEDPTTEATTANAPVASVSLPELSGPSTGGAPGGTAMSVEPPQGISNGTAAGIIGGGSVLFILLLILL